MIAFIIIAELAVFAIPKILNTSTNTTNNAIAKETIGTFTQAYTLYRVNNTITASTAYTDLTPYLQYVRVDSTSTIDGRQTEGSVTCTATSFCLVLPNGAYVRQTMGHQFNGTGALNALDFYIDPDGVYSGSTSGPGKSLHVFMYFNGKIRTRGTIDANTATTYDYGVTPFTYAAANPALDPTWFTW